MTYDFQEIEAKWQKFWAENETFKASPSPSKGGEQKPKYYVLDMFPYPSGAGLHVGHPLGYIASDIVARYKRHKQFNVLHPMGYDSFGLPAEQYAIQTGQHPEKTTAENIARYREQLDKIGFSFDWSREVKTSDPKFYKWTQLQFLWFFDSWYNLETQEARSMAELLTRFDNHGTEGTFAACGEELHFTPEEWAGYNDETRERILQNYRLAYRAESTVNWCPALGTVLANDEVKDGRSERGGHPVFQKKMMQWSLRISAYAERLLAGLEDIDWSESLKESQRNWIGKSKGASVHFSVKDFDEKIEVFTTRPDTIFGVSFMVLAPEHPLVEKITAKDKMRKVEAYQEEAARKTERDRQADVKNVSGEFTGAYGIHPFTKKEIPIWIADYVLASYGTGAVMAVPAHDSRDWAFAKHFGLEIPEVVSGGNPEKESYDAKEGTLVNSDFLNGLNVSDAIAKAIQEIENQSIGKGKTNFRLRDAIFGRQRYWGEPIPIYYENGLPKKVREEHLPLELPQVDKYLPTEDGEPPLARAEKWHYHPEKGVVKKGEGFPLETTTMPGWAGSSWYDLRYMDPHKADEMVGESAADYWQDVDLYIGGSEHATGHLLYTRFWHKFLKDKGVISEEEPFKKLINQGMIMGEGAGLFGVYIQFEPQPSSKELMESKKLPRPTLRAVLLVVSDKIYNDFENDNFESAEKWAENYLIENNGKEGFASGYDFQHLKVRVPISFLIGNTDELNRISFSRDWRQNKGNIEFLENEPYLTYRETEKMSKSKFNVVNPDDIIRDYGADTLRMYEMFLGPLEQSKPWNTAGISGVHNFLKKFWRLFHNKNEFNISDEKPNPKELKSLHTLIKKVNEDIQNFSFNTSISAFMICVNELTDLKCSKREILKDLTVCLSPFCAAYCGRDLGKVDR